MKPVNQFMSATRKAGLHRSALALLAVAIGVVVLTACSSPTTQGQPKGEATSSEQTSTSEGSGSEGSGSVTYALGDIGPGGGLVFLISGGLTYEMAPSTWGANETTGIQWCSNFNSVSTGTAVGTGSANTTAMLTDAGAFSACTGSAPNAARAYRGGGQSDWFLPSKDELNAMCNYSRNPSAPPTGVCHGRQNAAFARGDYGFARVYYTDYYWSSSQTDATAAWNQGFVDGYQANGSEGLTLRVRPVRAF